MTKRKRQSMDGDDTSSITVGDGAVLKMPQVRLQSDFLRTLLMIGTFVETAL